MAANTVKDFKNIDSTDALLDFLVTKGGNHDNYHHYTDIDSIIKMISSNFFHMTQGNSITMNDQHECMAKGAHKVWDRTYIGSFAFGEGENMAMWGLYGLPWEDAVRITIPRKAMQLWISNVDTIYEVYYDNDICKMKPIKEKYIIRLSDIVYISGKQNSLSSKLYWNESSLSLKDNQSLIGVDIEPTMTGFIKNDAWKYENEVRIHIQFSNPVNCDKIAIELPDEVIHAMTITAGPYFKEELYKRIEKKIPHIIGNEQAQDSGFKHLVQFRSLCSLCKYQEFQRKTR